MFERFSEANREVVVRAHEWAVVLKHPYIATEHLLLALCEDELAGGQALRRLGVTPDRVYLKVMEIADEGEEPIIGRIPFTPRAKKMLEYALREALSLGHNYIGTEHTAMALGRDLEHSIEGDLEQGPLQDLSALILHSWGLGYQVIKDESIKLISGPDGLRVRPLMPSRVRLRRGTVQVRGALNELQPSHELDTGGQSLWAQLEAFQREAVALGLLQ